MHYKQECIPVGCVPSAAVAVSTTAVDRILDTRYWKHYLSATSFSDGKYCLFLWRLEEPNNTNWNRDIDGLKAAACSPFTSIVRLFYCRIIIIFSSLRVFYSRRTSALMQTLRLALTLLKNTLISVATFTPSINTSFNTSVKMRMGYGLIQSANANVMLMLSVNKA